MNAVNASDRVIVGIGTGFLVVVRQSGRGIGVEAVDEFAHSGTKDARRCRWRSANLTQGPGVVPC